MIVVKATQDRDSDMHKTKSQTMIFICRFPQTFSAEPLHFRQPIYFAIST